MSEYLLPFHPDLSVEDRLGILGAENDSPEVAQAPLLRKLLKDAMDAVQTAPEHAIGLFIELLETIAYTIHANGELDLRMLKRFLVEKQSELNVVQAIQNIILWALQLEDLGGSHVIKQLSSEHFRIGLPAVVVNALLAHEVLGTLRQPEGNNWGIPGFLSWYTGFPRHTQAVEGYLTMLFAYFAEIDLSEADYVFELSRPNTMRDLSACNLYPVVEINAVNGILEPVAEVEGAMQFVLVAANKQPGPGPTGTQEERLQAMSPVLTLSSLLCPSLPDGAAIVTSAVPVLGCWTGHNRSARLAKLYHRHERPWRRYIIADALALDEISVDERRKLPDLLHGNTDREILKLWAAFLGAQHQAESKDSRNVIIEAPPWGCGAFGGNIIVKMLCMMVAAGLSQVRVRLTIPEKDYGKELATLTNIVSMSLTVAETAQLLHSWEDGTEQDVIDSLAPEADER